MSTGAKVAIGVVAGFVVFCLAIAAISGAQKDSASSAAASSSRANSTTIAVPETTTAAPSETVPAETPAVVIPADCEVAPQKWVDTLNGGFNPDGPTVENVFVAPDGDLLYIAANIYESAGGKRISSADLWVAKGDALFSLSSDARSRTIFPDGRKITTARISSDAGQKATNCTIAARGRR